MAAKRCALRKRPLHAWLQRKWRSEHLSARDRHVRPYEGSARLAQLIRTSSEHDHGTDDQSNRGRHAHRAAGGRTQQRFFRPERRRTIRTRRRSRSTSKSAPSSTRPTRADPDQPEAARVMSQGCGTIVLKNPGAKHGSRSASEPPELEIQAALLLRCGLIERPNIRICGRVGWSCAET